MISGSPTVNPDQLGTKCACWYRLTVAAGSSVELRPVASTRRSTDALAEDFVSIINRRQAEADEFYAELTPPSASTDDRL